MKLRKELRSLDVFCIASGAMISSGIFILPGLAFKQAGPSVIVSYLLAGILALLGLLSVIELVTAMPKAGGDYYYVTRSLGPLVGTISGILGWFALSLKTAFAVFGLAEVTHIIAGVPILATGAVVCIIFTWLNIKGIEGAAKLEVGLVAALLSLMLLYVLVGARDVTETNYLPFAPHGINAMLLTAGFVFVSFGGLLKVATVAEEVRNPTRSIPQGMLAAVGAITLIYAAILFVTVGVMPADVLAGSVTPLADAAGTTAGRAGYWAMSVAALMAFVTTANAGIMSASRYPLALGRDQLIPGFLCRISPRYGTPVVAIILTGTAVFVSLLLPLELLVKAASTVVLTAYVLAAVAVIILRRSNLQNYRPTFRVPLYPWLPLLTSLIFMFLIVDMGLATIEISLSLVGLAGLVYLFYGRKSNDQDYALMYLVKSITSQALVTSSLESELRQVVHERDQIEYDEIDELVEKAEIIDIDGHIERQEVFERVAERLSSRLATDRETLVKKLIDREHETSTVISPFVAIPHVILEGEDRFDIAIVRCRDGAQFSLVDTGVKALFVIAGTRDRRNLHLKALAAIAHVVQHPDFEQRWLKTREPALLRDIFLLSRRVRSVQPDKEDSGPPGGSPSEK
jgi:amino acid transporter/mannitol/fructose-specific phosphotransferase system IIA component (Ntr-type)